MNKMVKIIIRLMTCIVMVTTVNAKSTFSESEKTASNYLNENIDIKDTYSRFLKVVENRNKFYTYGSPTESYRLGGLLSYEEFKITTRKKSNTYSYLFESDEYWTNTMYGTNERMVVSRSDKPVKPTNSPTPLYGTRVTEYVKNETRVSGTGTFSDPWIFEPQFNVTLKSNNPSRGKIKGESDSDYKEEITITVSANNSTPKKVFLQPASGYEYLGNSCGIIINDISLRNGDTPNQINVQGVSRDIECTINFGERPYEIILEHTNAPFDDATTPDPERLYVIKDKGWYVDKTAENAITKIVTPSSMGGYTYHGYYTDKNVNASNEFMDSCSGTQIIDPTTNVIASAYLRTDGSVGTKGDEKTTIYKDMKIYPCFKPIKYTINYSCNGGTGTVKSTNHVYNTPAKLAAGTNCKKTGYTFSGWNRKEDGSGENFNANADKYAGITTEATITLYANWQANPYTIKYDMQNSVAGTYAPTSATYDTPFRLSNPTRVGYTFDGWTVTANLDTTNARYGNAQNNVTTKLNKSSIKVKDEWFLNLSSTANKQVTIKANLTANKYNISYETNGGKLGSKKPSTGTYNTNVEISNPTKTGYTFIGWKVVEGLNAATALHGTGSSKVTNSIPNTDTLVTSTFFKNLNPTSGANVKLEAFWEPKTYTIKYALDSGQNGTYAPTSAIYDKPVRISNASKLGYTFTGWKVSKNLDTKNAKYGNAENNVTTSLTKDSTKVTDEWFMNLNSSAKEVTLTATYSKNTYTIEYNVNGGTLGKSSPTSGTYTSVLTIPNPTRTGYTFTGWTFTSGLDLTTAVYGSSSTPKTAFTDANTPVKVKYFKNLTPVPNGKVVMKANWNPITYKVKFDANGGANAPSTITCTYDIECALPSLTFTYTDHTLFGLTETKLTPTSGNPKVDYKDGDSVINLSSKQDETITLYAAWSIDYECTNSSHSITYNKDKGGWVCVFKATKESEDVWDDCATGGGCGSPHYNVSCGGACPGSATGVCTWCGWGDGTLCSCPRCTPCKGGWVETTVYVCPSGSSTYSGSGSSKKCYVSAKHE